MTLLAIVIVLLLEWYFRVSADYRSFRWFIRWRGFMRDQFPGQFEGTGGLLFIAGLPALLLAVVLALWDNWLVMLVELAVSAAILWYCIGPRDLRTTLAAYFDAMERGNAQSAWEHVRGVVEVEAVDDDAQMGRRVSQYIFTEINRRYVAVLFWFALLGPAACLFYRLMSLYTDMLRLEPGHPHQVAVRRITQVLDWVPARLTALAYTLVGDFMRGYAVLHSFWKDANASSERILIDTGLAALALGPEPEGDALDENVQAMALAERALLFILVLIALLSVFGVLI